MEKIATYYTDGSSSMAFTNIPIDKYKHLVFMVGSIGTVSPTGRSNLSFAFNNSDTSFAYKSTSIVHVLINGTAYNEPYSYSGNRIGVGYNKISNEKTFGGTWHIMNAGSNSAGKSVVALLGSRTGTSTEMYGVELQTGSWADTAPVTSIEITFGSPIAAGGIISLYGIKG
jgi:hypothetical protein